MSRPTMDVNGPEYQEILKQRELRRTYKSDYPDVKWVHDAMDRLEKKQPHGDYTDKDYADFRKAQEIVDRITIKYSPDQPRDDWGRWVDAGGDGSGGTSPSGGNNTVDGYHVYNPSPDKLPGRDVVDQPLSKPLNVDKTIDVLHGHVNPGNVPGRNCARNVANAIRSNGIPVTPPPPPPGKDYPFAKDYGMPLEAAGLGHIADNGSSGSYPPVGYIPRKGDVVVMQPTSDPQHPEGHIAMYDGKQWVSDFKQQDFWPGPGYRKERPGYVIYRHQSQI